MTDVVGGSSSVGMVGISILVYRIDVVGDGRPNFQGYRVRWWLELVDSLICWKLGIDNEAAKGQDRVEVSHPTEHQRSDLYTGKSRLPEVQIRVHCRSCNDDRHPAVKVE